MSGSLFHILNDDGTFRFDLVENERDTRMALEECHQIIAELLECMTLAEGHDPQREFGINFHGVRAADKPALLAMVCQRLGFPVPTASNEGGNAGHIVYPIIQRELLGAESVYKPDGGRNWLVWDSMTHKWLGHRTFAAGWKLPMPEAHIAVPNIDGAARLTRAEAEEWRALDKRYLIIAAPEGL